MGSLGSDHKNLEHEAKSLDIVQVFSLHASAPVLSPSTCCLHVDMYRASATSDFQLNLASRSLGRDGKRKRQSWGISQPWFSLHKVLHWLCPLTEGHCSSQGRMLSSSGTPYPFSLLILMVLWVVPVCIGNLLATIYPPPHNGLQAFICPGFCGAVILVHILWVLWLKVSHKATVTMWAEIADSSEASVGKKVQFQAPSCGY